MAFKDYRSRYDSLFENADFKRIAHLSTGGLCCWCAKVESTQLHHAVYCQGDKLGQHLFPVCDWCHDKSNPIGVHSSEYWIRDRLDPVTGNRNTVYALQKLKSNYQRLSQWHRSKKSNVSWNP